MRSSFACLPTIVFVGATACNAARMQSGQHVVGVDPVTLVRGFILVTATINGSGPYRMLVDTGASACSLTPKAAQRAGLAVDHRVVLSTLAGETIIPATSDARVQVGPVEEAGVEVLVQDLTGACKVLGGIDGKLGQSFLKRSPYLIDYRHRQLAFGHNAMRLAETLPIAVEASESDGRLTVPVVLDKEPRTWRLTIDSGASHLVLFCGRRCPQMQEMASGTLTTDSGIVSAQCGVLKRIQIGSSVFPGRQAFIASSTSEGREDGLLPMNWFSAIYVDSIHHFVRLAYGKWSTDLRNPDAAPASQLRARCRKYYTVSSFLAANPIHGVIRELNLLSNSRRSDEETVQ